MKHLQLSFDQLEGAVLPNFVVEQFATDKTGRLLFHKFTNLAVQFLYLLHSVSVDLLSPISMFPKYFVKQL